MTRKLEPDDFYPVALRKLFNDKIAGPLELSEEEIRELIHCNYSRIIAYIRKKYNLLIGERTAEQLKIEIGSNDEILPFNTEWETSERLFVNLEDLPKYIKWAKVYNAL